MFRHCRIRKFGPLWVAHDVVHNVAPEDVAQAVRYWLTRYGRNSAEAARNIRQLAASAPGIVVEAVLPLFEAGSSGEATSFLCKLLSNCDSTAVTLCGQAVALDASMLAAKVLVQHEPHFDARLARSLLHAGHMTEASRHRGFEILEKLGRPAV